MTAPEKSLVLLKAAAFAEGMAAPMLIIFVPYYVRSGLEESSLTMVSLIISLPALTTLVASNFWGALADITGRYALITSICLAGFFLCLLAVPLMGSALAVMATVGILSLLYGAVRPLLLSHATLLNEDAKPRAISAILLFESLGFFISGLLFGNVYDPINPVTGCKVFPIPGLICLGVAVLLLLKIKQPPARGTPAGSGQVLASRIFSSLTMDLQEVYRSGALRRLCTVVLLATMSNFCLFGMYSMFFTEAVEGTHRLMSHTLALSTLLGVPCFMIAGRWVQSRGGLGVLMFALIMWIMIYALLSLVRNPYLAAALFAVPIYPFFLVSTNALAAEASQSERRGGGLGALAGITALSMALGTVLGGAVGDLMGLRAIPSISVLVTSLALLLFIILMGMKESNQSDGTR